MRNSVIGAIILAICIVFAVQAAWSATPATIGFQGVLLGSDGNPVPDGDYTIIFSIWDDSVGGIQYWTETQTVQTYNGGANVAMGDVNAIDYEGFPQNGYLQIQVGGDSPMTPRILLSSEPYSFFAKRIIGDVETSPGLLRVRDSESDPVNVELQASGNQGTVAINDGSFERFALDVSPLSSGMSLAIPNATGGNRGKLIVGVDNVETSLGIEHEDIGASLTAKADSHEVAVSMGIESNDLGASIVAKADSDGTGLYMIDSFFDVWYDVNLNTQSMVFSKFNPDGLPVRAKYGPGEDFIVDSFFDVEYRISRSVDANGGHLTVANIGSSGEDGVSVEVESTKSEILLFENNSSTSDSSGARIGVNNDESVINLGIDSDDLGVVSSAKSSAGRFGSSHTSGFNSSTGKSSEARIRADSGGAGFHAVDSFFDVEYRIDYSTSDSAAESHIQADDALNSFGRLDIATPDLYQETCSGSHENGHSFIIQSIDNQGSSGEYKWMPDIGDEVIVGFNADSGGAQLRLSNIGSSGQDGVTIGAGDNAATCGIEHEDIGGSVAAVNSSADDSGGRLIVSNIGSSGEDGVSASADSNGSRIALYTEPTGDVPIEIVALSIVPSEPVIVVRKPDALPTDAPVMEYFYDNLYRLTLTLRDTDPAPGDSSMTSASGFHVFDGAYGLHFDTNGLTIADAAGTTCSMHRTGTLTLKRGIVAAQDPTSSVGIGAPSTGYKLYVDGDVCATGNYLSCSDLRFKKNINTIGGAVDKISRLRGVKFDWRKNEFPERNFPDERQLGMIAQEVLEVAPEAVSQDDQGYYSVDYARLVPILVEAVKEQQKTIDSMQKKLEENDSLKTQLGELKSIVQQIVAKDNLSNKTITETTSY